MSLSSSLIVDHTATLTYLKSWFLFLTFIYVLIFVEKSFPTSMCSQMLHILEYPTQILFPFGFWPKGSVNCEIWNQVASLWFDVWTHGVLLSWSAGAGRLCTSFLPLMLLSVRWLSWTWKCWSVQARGINRCNSPDSVTECFLSCCSPTVKGLASAGALLWQILLFAQDQEPGLNSLVFPTVVCMSADFNSPFVL